jgi:hypothetical protein
MATEGEYVAVPVETTVDLSAIPLHRAINVNGTIASTDVLAAGLLKSRGPIGAGVSMGISGYMKAWAGASIAIGARVMTTTSGYMISATSGHTGCGRALEAANSGDLFAGMFSFAPQGTLSF